MAILHEDTNQTARRQGTHGGNRQVSEEQKGPDQALSEEGNTSLCTRRSHIHRRRQAQKGVHATRSHGGVLRNGYPRKNHRVWHGRSHRQHLSYIAAKKHVMIATHNVGSPFHVAGVADPVARLVDWYNDLPHMSLLDGRETPAEACVRKQAPKDTTAEERGEDLHAKA